MRQPSLSSCKLLTTSSSIVDNEAALVAALKQDLGKSEYESYSTEIDWVKNDIIFINKNLHKWAADESAADIDLTMRLIGPKIRKDPMGCVLVIGAYNYPMQLSMGPFLGAICAGNTAILKPSEQAPATAMVLARVCSVLDPSAFGVVQGGVPETTELLAQKWDLIFYTGGAVVGKIIARKAAETLTPVALELGGKNPAIVARTADARLAARRVLWTKFHNVGQVCISQNYVLVDREILPAFRRELLAAYAEFRPDYSKGVAGELGVIATDRHFARLRQLLADTRGTVLAGGDSDEATRFLAPTVVEVADATDPLVQDETFGPIVTVLPVDSLDEAIRIANEVDPTPLGAYPFGSRKDTDRVLQELRSGGATVNDSMFHGALPTLSFGGVGGSGNGAYRGKASFDCFSHRRSIVTTPGWMESMLAVRYPPYAGKLAQFQKMNNRKPPFDRDGNVHLGLVRWLLTLGAGSATGGAARYAVIVLGELVHFVLDRG